MVLPAPGTSIAVSQIQTEFTPITNPVPMDAKLRFPSTTYTPTTPTIPVTPSTILKMSDYNGKSKVSVTPFITPFTAPGTWTSPFTGNIKVLCVGAGGAGGTTGGTLGASGGGGGVELFIIHRFLLFREHRMLLLSVDQALGLAAIQVRSGH